jgi:ferritin-like metal-binding protein YciE
MKQGSKSATAKTTVDKNSRAATNGTAAKKSTTQNNTGETDTSGETDNIGEEQESLLEKFFKDQLMDIYYAEQQIVKALPKMQEACTTEELKEAFNDHLHQTQKHVKRLEKAFEAMGEKAQGKKCEAIEGIIKESESIIKETKEGSMTRDAALIMAAQKVEHYEIATYGGLVQLAITIGQHEVADILDKTLMEEESTDQKLTDIAESYINIEAEEENRYSSKKKLDVGTAAMA